MRFPRTILIWAVFLTGTATLLASAIRLASAPVRFDEADFVEMGEAAARGGAPRVPSADDLRVMVPSAPLDTKYGQRYGMWHPPLYLYSIALTGSLFGFHDTVMRLTSAAWLILTLIVVWFLLRQLNAGAGTWPLTIGLFGLTPLLREGALFIDIDNTATTTTTLLFFALFFKYQDRVDGKALGILSAALCACLWAKLTTPVIMMAAAGAYHAASGGSGWSRFRLGAVQLAGVTICGLLMFVISYAAYCAAFEYPWQYMFEVTFLAKRDRITGQGGLLPVLRSARWNMVWASPAVTAATLAAVALRCRRWVKDRHIERIDLLTLFVILGIAAYIVRTATIGKYSYPVWAGALIVVAWELSRSSRTTILERPVLLLGALIGLEAAAMALIPNVQFRPPQLDTDTSKFWAMLSDPRVRTLIIAALLAVCAGIAGVVTVSKVSCGSAFLTGLVLGAVSLNPIDAWKGMFFGVDGRSPLRPGMETGYVATANYLAANCGTDDIIMAPKDLALRLNRKAAVRYAPLDYCHGVSGDEGVRRAISDLHVRFLIVETYVPGGIGFDPTTEPRFRNKQSFSDFTVYEFGR